MDKLKLKVIDVIGFQMPLQLAEMKADAVMNLVSSEYSELLNECKEALINRDAVKCYNSGHEICQCTLCKINRKILFNQNMKP